MIRVVNSSAFKFLFSFSVEQKSVRQLSELSFCLYAKKMMTSSESLELELGSLSRSDSLTLLRNLAPVLSWESHKGECGRIGIIGGCREYTGAPYFAAISALRLGCDLAHVFCTSDASPVIKSYSPELIVHPLLDAQGAVTKITPWMPRLHSIVVGPGLGRDKNLADTVMGLLKEAIDLDISIVIDADGIFFISQNPEVIKGHKKITLTPNAVEFERLYATLIGKDLPKDDLPSAVYEVCNSLKGVNIVCKGKEDILSDGTHVLLCKNEGSPRRCGGQGDLLSGATGVWQFWANKVDANSKTNASLEKYGPQLCGAYAACWLTRECNKLAFAANKRSTLTTDMINEIGLIMKNNIDSTE